MPKTSVDCPHCNTELTVEKTAKDMIVDCPKCNGQMTIEGYAPNWDGEVTTQVLAKINMGRAVAIVLIVITLSISFITLTGILSKVPSGTVSTSKACIATVRTLLTCFLCLAIFKGQQWARVLFAILTALAGTFSFIVIPLAKETALKSVGILIIVGIVYMALSITALVSKSLKIYQDSKCGQIHKHC